MPTKERSEDDYIKHFLSEYECNTWANAEIEWPDKTADRGIDALATRKKDGKRLAIEHTLIQPFANDKKDLKYFRNAGFLEIEKDKSLLVPNRWIQVFIPVGTLEDTSKSDAGAVAVAIREWLKLNIHSLINGYSQQNCPVAVTKKKPAFNISLTVRVTPLPGPGALHIRRQQIESNLEAIIKKMLEDKLPKLTEANVDKRILLLERQHMNLLPTSIFNEIENQRAYFPKLQYVDEIWMVETMFYEEESFLGFECYESPVDNFYISSVTCPPEM